MESHSLSSDFTIQPSSLGIDKAIRVISNTLDEIYNQNLGNTSMYSKSPSLFRNNRNAIESDF